MGTDTFHSLNSTTTGTSSATANHSVRQKIIYHVGTQTTEQAHPRRNKSKTTNQREESHASICYASKLGIGPADPKLSICRFTGRTAAPSDKLGVQQLSCPPNSRLHRLRHRTPSTSQHLPRSTARAPSNTTNNHHRPSLNITEPEARRRLNRRETPYQHLLPQQLGRRPEPTARLNRPLSVFNCDRVTILDGSNTLVLGFWRFAGNAPHHHGTTITTTTTTSHPALRPTSTGTSLSNAATLALCTRHSYSHSKVAAAPRVFQVGAKALHQATPE